MSVLAQGDDNTSYPVSGGYTGGPSLTFSGVELVLCDQTDAGKCEPADLPPPGSGSCEITSGPSPGYEKAPIAFTATIKNDGSTPHVITASLGRDP